MANDYNHSIYAAYHNNLLVRAVYRVVDEKKYDVDDLKPTSPTIDSALFRELNGAPLAEKSYEISNSANTFDGKTDDDGKAAESDIDRKDLKVSLTLGSEGTSEEENYPDNPGPLDSLDLRNPDEDGNGPVKKASPRSADLVKQIQTMLHSLGYDLGTTGTENDGVDGDFGEITESAVKEFQAAHNDYEDNSLVVDGIVGPRTSDALNREMVGLWYAKYRTPSKLNLNRIIVTVVSTDLQDGIEIEEEEGDGTGEKAGEEESGGGDEEESGDDSEDEKGAEPEDAEAEDDSEEGGEGTKSENGDTGDDEGGEKAAGEEESEDALEGGEKDDKSGDEAEKAGPSTDEGG